MKANILVMDGIIVLNKPAGITSARAVARVKRLLPKGTKIGHAGTLDPFATGVLLLLVGRGTKHCEKLMDQPKQYDATVCLGATTATDDPESPATAWPAIAQTDFLAPTVTYISTVLTSFIGEISQTPPIFSALRVGGRRAYDLARNGTPPTMLPRTVKIYDLQLMYYHWPELKLKVDCGRGTYIRALGRDIGAVLNVGGYLTALTRTRIGNFSIESACTMDKLTAQTLPSVLVPLERIQA
jgi:tRNA pseudouridine55 synthase